jgi:hypothetical protein
MSLQKQLHDIYLKHPANLFNEFAATCEATYTAPAHTLLELRTRDNKKIRGDMFEEFCALYLKHVRGYDTVWRLEEVPEDILTLLKLKRKDMGIDLIVSHAGAYYAVQCKYRQADTKKTCITWSALSTFYALCLRTGPWEKYIVMATADYTRRQGPKTDKDISICLGTFRGLKTDEWLKMCGTPLAELPVPQELSQENLRAKRLAFYSKAVPSPTDKSPPPS